jgi:hypothetical protein
MRGRSTPLAGIEVIADIIGVFTTAVWAFEIGTFIPQVVIQGFTDMAPYVMYFRQTIVCSSLIVVSYIHFN